MLLLTITLTAGLIAAVVVGDHVLEISRPKLHMVFLYAAMGALTFATFTAQATGAVT